MTKRSKIGQIYRHGNAVDYYYSIVVSTREPYHVDARVTAQQVFRTYGLALNLYTYTVMADELQGSMNSLIP